MRKLLLVTTLVVSLTAATVVAASAARPERYRTDGNSLSTWWTQVDGPPAAGQQFGNVHLGWLDAWESSTGKADVFAYVDDFSCPVGVMPYDGSGKAAGRLVADGSVADTLTPAMLATVYGVRARVEAHRDGPSVRILDAL